MLDAGSKIRNIIMSFKFEKLTIWQDSMDFGEKIFKISINFQKKKRSI